MKHTLSAFTFVLMLSAFLVEAQSQTQDFGTIGKNSRREARQLRVFDDLDYNVFSNQEWENLHRSHSKDVIVHWPDGRITKGRDVHIEDLKYLFTYAPDTRIKEHPIKIAKKNWTAVQGIMEGTFTRPMTLADGTVIQPNGKKFKISMVTLARWENGVMAEEFLSWDNLTYMRQLDLIR